MTCATIALALLMIVFIPVVKSQTPEHQANYVQILDEPAYTFEGYYFLAGKNLVCKMCTGDTYLKGICTDYGAESDCVPCPSGHHQPGDPTSHVRASCDPVPLATERPTPVMCGGCPDDLEKKGCSMEPPKVICCKMDLAKPNGNPKCIEYLPEESISSRSEIASSFEEMKSTEVSNEVPVATAEMWATATVTVTVGEQLYEQRTETKARASTQETDTDFIAKFVVVLAILVPLVLFSNRFRVLLFRQVPNGRE